MSGTRPKHGRNACFLCFRAKHGCNGESKSCCSHARPNQLSIEATACIGEDAESSFIADLRGYVLKFQATSGLESHPFELSGPIDITNKDFVAKFDDMTKKWTLEIQAKDEAVKSISLACRVISYFNVLAFAKLENNSDPPFHEIDLSHIFAYFILMRIKDLVASIMTPVRGAQYELDAESRSFMVIMFPYLSNMCKRVPGLGRCGLSDNVDLFEHVKKFFDSFREEQKIRLATDCRNKDKVDWCAPLNVSRRGLFRKFDEMEVRMAEPWTLSIMVIPCNDDGPGDCTPDLHASYSTSQSNISFNGPGLKSPGTLLEAPEFYPSQPSTTTAFPNPAPGASSNGVLASNNADDSNRGLGDGHVRMGTPEGAGVGDSGINGLAGYGYSFHELSDHAFRPTFSANSGVNLKIHFATCNEVPNHGGDLIHSGFVDDSWQTPQQNPIYNGSLPVYDASDQLQGQASVDARIGFRPNETLNTRPPSTTWPDSDTNTLPPATSGFTSDQQSVFPASPINLAYPGFPYIGNTDTDFEPFTPHHFPDDYFGDHYTSS